MNSNSRELVPWFVIFMSLCGAIFASSSLATLVHRLLGKRDFETEAPDVTRAASLSIYNMPLVSKAPDQPEWYLYSSAEPTRDDDDDLESFRKNVIARR